jgi:hypothetical protein
VGPGVLRDEIGVGAKAVARPFDLDDDGVVQEPIEQRGGDDGSPKTSPHSAKCSSTTRRVVAWTRALAISIRHASNCRFRSSRSRKLRPRKKSWRR